METIKNEMFNNVKKRIVRQSKLYEIYAPTKYVFKFKTK